MIEKRNLSGGDGAGGRLAAAPQGRTAGRFTRHERVFLGILLTALLAFGAIVERRTALRTNPMTDFGVFTCAAWAANHGGNLYGVTDWHGWHYQYPPLLAILMGPFEHPAPAQVYPRPPTPRTRANTEWGYLLAGPSQFEPLSSRNLRFFWLVAGWYLLNVALLLLSLQLLACLLEGTPLRSGPPAPARERRQWWARRLVPALVCAGSIGTDLSRGQVDLLLLFGIVGGLYLYANQREWRAGLCLAFPLCVKLLPVLLLWPLWRLRGRLLGGLAAGLVLGLAVIPAVWFGPAGALTAYRQWVEVLAKPMLGHGTDTSRHEELVRMDGTDNQSVLTFVHRTENRGRQAEERTVDVSPGERHLALGVGVGALALVLAAAGLRTRESPRSAVLFCGLLTGVALLFSPVVHNYYFLLMLPLVAALVDRNISVPASAGFLWASLTALVLFAGTDAITRFPASSFDLRGLGIPLATLLALMAVGAVALREERGR